MANEGKIPLGESGITNAFVKVMNAAGQVNIIGGNTFETDQIAHLDQYDIALVELGNSGVYTFTFPATITTAGRYYAVPFRGMPATPVINEYIMYIQEIVWNGSAEVFEIDTAGKVTTDDASRTASKADVSALATEENATANKEAVIAAMPDTSNLAQTGEAAAAVEGLATELNATANKESVIAAMPDTSNLAQTGEADAAVATLNDVSAVEVVDAILAMVGVTVGGTWTLAKILKIIAAWNAGNWRQKSGSTTTQELLDAEDVTTVILEMILSKTTPFRTITVKI